MAQENGDSPATTGRALAQSGDSGPDEADTLRIISADLPVNATLHLWLKAAHADKPGSVSLHSANGKFGEVQAVNAEENSFRIYHVFGGGRIEQRYDRADTSVSVAYWFTAADVLETGITVLHANPVNARQICPPAIISPALRLDERPNGSALRRPTHHSPALFAWPHMEQRTGAAVSSDYRWRTCRSSSPLGGCQRCQISAGLFGSAIPCPAARASVFFTEKVSGENPSRRSRCRRCRRPVPPASFGHPAAPAGRRGLTLDFAILTSGVPTGAGRCCLAARATNAA
jgi:beta-fructofuranosidase